MFAGLSSSIRVGSRPRATRNGRGARYLVDDRRLPARLHMGRATGYRAGAWNQHGIGSRMHRG